VDTDADVLVIGAGVAGLAAAAELARARLAVHILEARDRIGGRICTRHDPRLPLPVELGAEFVHGKPPELWELPLSPYEVAGERWCFRRGKLAKCDEFPGSPESVFRKMRDYVPPDRSYAQFLDECRPHEDSAFWATAYVEGFNAASKERISVLSLVREDEAAGAIEGERHFRLPCGYDRVPELLWSRASASGARLALDTAATGVRWRPGLVEVETAGGRLRAGAAIITLPLGVLQAARIPFSPEPADILQAAGRLEMGKAVRLILHFRERFWDRCGLAGMSFLHAPEAAFPTWWTTLPFQAPLLTAWAAGPNAEALAGRSEREITAAALAELEGMLGREAHSLIEDTYMHDWTADPFSCGAYSYTPAGSLDARSELATPVADTLYFAGEAADTRGYGGTVHGAISSGRAAAALLSSRRQPGQTQYT
jgi:hypothetical protein